MKPRSLPSLLSLLLVTLAIVAGSLADRPRSSPLLTLGGYRVLQVDFHTHSSTWSDGALTPFGLVIEAMWQGLDAIAITGHNEVGDAYVGRWFSRLIGGPIILIGEEVVTPHHHIIAAGIRKKVNFLQSAADTIESIHRDGGIAIAAHPLAPGNVFEDAAVARLDGSEICHPLSYAEVDGQEKLEAFFARRGVFAAIGSSDYHGLGPMGLCRTYVFVREQTAEAILDAVRKSRTVVYGPRGQVYGDPELVALARSDGRFGESIPTAPRSALDWISGIGGLLGLCGVLAFKARA